MKAKKKILSIFLAVCMLLTLSTTAFASSAPMEYEVYFYDGGTHTLTGTYTYNMLGVELPDCGTDGWQFESYKVSDEDGTEILLEAYLYTSSADNNVVTQELMDVLSDSVDASSVGYTLRYKAFTNRGGSGSTEISDEYGQVILKPAEGTKLLTKDGQPLESVLVTIEGQDGYWYRVGERLDFVIEVEAGYTQMFETFNNVNGGGGVNYDEENEVYYGIIAAGENTIQTWSEKDEFYVGRNAMSSRANMEENFFEIMGYASTYVGNSKYFSEGSAAPEKTVFWFLNQTEELNVYCSYDTGYVDIPYQAYMNIANAYFTDAPEMKTYLTNSGYLDAETELIHYYLGGTGSDWAWVLTAKDSFSENGISGYKLRGIFCFGLVEDTAGFTEYVDYYVYNGSAYEIDSAVELTLVRDEIYGYRIAAYTQKPYYLARTEDMGDCIYAYSEDTKSFSDVYYCIYSNNGDWGLDFVYEDGTYTKFDNHLCYAADQEVHWSVIQNGQSSYSYECDKVYIYHTLIGEETGTYTGSSGTISGSGEVWLWAEPCVEFKMDAPHCKVEVLQGLADRGDGTYSYYVGGAIELRITPDVGYEITEVASYLYDVYVVKGTYISASGTWLLYPDFVPSTILVTTTSTGGNDTGIIIKSGEDSAAPVTVQIPEEAEKVSGLTLVAEELEEKAEEQADSLIINQLGAEADNIYILDIHFENADGEETQVNVTMVVTIPLPEGWDSENVGVYYVNTDTGEVVDMNAVVSEDGKTVSFTTDHFSYYALVKTANGTWGEDIMWTLTDDGVLTISGKGRMKDDLAPWYEYRERIKTAVIGEGITNIGFDAFTDCINLTSISIPATVDNTDYVHFYNCPSLVEISVSEESPYFANGENGVLLNKDRNKIVRVPNGMSGSYTVPVGITEIGIYAFLSCNKLNEIIIPESVTKIEDYAFECCNGISSITIPASVTNIAEGTFNNCTKLAEVTFAGKIDRIGQYAFRGCPITEISIPDGTDIIGIGAFSYCSLLTKVNLPDTVTVICDEAFSYCNNLTGINIPEKLEFIGYYAFNNCKKLNIVLTIPECVTNICGDAFAGCTSISEIRFEGDVPSIEKTAFFGVTATAYYPEDNDTWTDDVKENFGGDITWVVYTPDTFTAGDVNCDGTITNADLVMIARYIVGLDTSADVKKYGDMNGDREITNVDVVSVARIIVGL